MGVYRTKVPKNIFIYILVMLVNILALWFLLFNHHVLVLPWLFICALNLLLILAVLSGWKRSVLLVDDRKIVICRPSGWIKQTNLIINLFEINHIEFEKDYVIIGRFDSQTAIKFGPLKKTTKLNIQLKQLLPKIVL